LSKSAAPARARDTFKLRLASALVLMPLVLAAVWFGPPWLPIAVAIAGAAMAWEWARMSGQGRFGAGEAVVTAAILGTVILAGFGHFGWAAALAVGAAAVSAWTRPSAWLWTGLGTLWIAAGLLAFLWLAGPGGGRTTMFWLLGVAWATDIGAYAAGKAIGGPKLAPSLSPNKTWAGMGGGVVAAALIGVVAAFLVPVPIARAVIVSAVLGLVAQGGDLAESQAKRHFRVKDASGLIPGHGGFLDRLDGLIAAVVAAALLTLALGVPILESD
jgi:phosphatidate cytidylyltransferase